MIGSGLLTYAIVTPLLRKPVCFHSSLSDLRLVNNGGGWTEAKQEHQGICYRLQIAKTAFPSVISLVSIFVITVLFSFCVLCMVSNEWEDIDYRGRKSIKNFIIGYGLRKFAFGMAFLGFLVRCHFFCSVLGQ